MPTDYIVRQGDYLSKIAHEFGLTERTIWNHPNNSALKAKRKSPNVLHPGDHLFIPDQEHRVEDRSTDAQHKFKTKGSTLKLRLVLEDLYEKPIANANCVLVTGSQVRNVTTDGNGRINEDLAPGTTTASILIQDPQTAFHSIEIPVKIGHLDPVEELSGQQARLNNLGYFPGEAADPKDEAFRSAVEEFQCEHGLHVDGDCGPLTQAKLKQVHGC